MHTELVRTTTRDGVQLDGVLQLPAGSISKPICVDAFCLVHGTGGNFYSSTLLSDLAERLLQLGCQVLRVNTRGHDAVSTAATAQGGKRQGAAYEIIDYCRHDLAAWMDWLTQQSGPRIGLIGHSMGAVKAIYALAREPSSAPACLVALSPPRLSYAAFCTGDSAPQFLETYARAEGLVAKGQPATLMDVQVPLPYLITAAGYVEKYGPDERYNFLHFLAGLTCPTLVTLGSNEVASNMAFRGLPEEVEKLAARRVSLHVRVIPGADHFYTGVRTELGDQVEEWLRSMPH